MATAKKTVSAADAIESLTAMNPEAFKEGYEKFAKSVTSVVDFHKGSLEAVMTSAGAVAKGFEKAAADQSAFVKASYEDAAAAGKAVASAKSLQDAFDVQSDYLRAAFEKNLGQFNKMADHWLATTKQSAEPITERYSEFVEMVQSYRP